MAIPAAAEGFAPAKVNLALHVTGRRVDGYHLLDSLVVFAGVGDRVTAEPADGLTLEVTGPGAAGVPADGTNLVLRAAALFGPGRGARIGLEKVLPAASGIGGGSADAAAALRVLARMWGVAVPEGAALALGADVPVCLAGEAARMRGIGEVLEPVPALPSAHLVLANPGVAVATPEVFRRLERRENPGLPEIGGWRDAAALAEWLRGTRNDLEAPALALAPEIGAVLARLGAQPGCLIARMSGSGATCFGMFGTEDAATRAAAALSAAEPGWWIAAAPMLGGQATRATT